jgi:hypothetical protein
MYSTFLLQSSKVENIISYHSNFQFLVNVHIFIFMVYSSDNRVNKNNKMIS